MWFDQSWLDLTFVHWPVRPDDVAHLYPPGTRPDVFDGMTYVGLVPFRMGYTKVGTGPALPYFGAFAETNVRLYSVDDAGRHGVLFRSLEIGATGGGAGHPPHDGCALHLGPDADHPVIGGDHLRQRSALAAPRAAQPGHGPRSARRSNRRRWRPG